MIVQSEKEGDYIRSATFRVAHPGTQHYGLDVKVTQHRQSPDDKWGECDISYPSTMFGVDEMERAVELATCILLAVSKVRVWMEDAK